MLLLKQTMSDEKGFMIQGITGFWSIEKGICTCEKVRIF